MENTPFSGLTITITTPIQTHHYPPLRPLPLPLTPPVPALASRLAPPLAQPSPTQAAPPFQQCVLGNPNPIVCQTIATRPPFLGMTQDEHDRLICQALTAFSRPETAVLGVQRQAERLHSDVDVGKQVAWSGVASGAVDSWVGEAIMEMSEARGREGWVKILEGEEMRRQTLVVGSKGGRIGYGETWAGGDGWVVREEWTEERAELEYQLMLIEQRAGAAEMKHVVEEDLFDWSK